MAANGRLIALKSTVTFHLTNEPGWAVSGSGTTIVIADIAPEGADGFVRLEVAEFPQIGDNLDSMAKTALATEQRKGKFRLTRSTNRIYGGIEGYVNKGSGPGGGFFEWGGLDSNNVLTTFSFYFPAGVDADDWVDPILASIARQR